jgi:succinate dehydrogenase / fumarate reductase flavoprotein subunit
MQAAVAAHARGASVALVGRTNPTRSYSVTIQDGLNAALGAGDSFEAHAAETAAAGEHLNDPVVTEWVCKDGPSLVEELDRWGVPFNRAGSAPALAQLDGSTRPRAVFADDNTGHILTQVLYEQVLKSGMKFYEECVVEEVTLEGSTVSGVVALDIATGKFEFIGARSVVLATGGPRRLYEPSTASLHCSGDGLALAFRLGVPLVDMEFVQYHPHVLKNSRLAVSELLTAGARTGGVSATGPALPRAMAAAIAEGQGEDGCLTLEYDFEKAMTARFFNTNQRVSGLAGLKVAGGKLPVRPAMHRLLGGISANYEGGTSVSGLFAAGECAGTGFHGAYGMPGNFLLASLSMARRTGRAAADFTGGRPYLPEAGHPAEQADTRRVRVLHQKSGVSTGQLRRELAETMHQHAGLVRTAAGLEAAARTIDRIADDYKRAGAGAAKPDYNFGYLHHLELGYLIETARAVVAAASARQESRGVHYRDDFPSPGPERQRTLVTHGAGGLTVSQRTL